MWLACVLLVETNAFPELVIFFWTTHFEHPSVLSRFCLWLHVCIKFAYMVTFFLLKFTPSTWKSCDCRTSLVMTTSRRPLWIFTTVLITRVFFWYRSSLGLQIKRINKNTIQIKKKGGTIRTNYIQQIKQISIEVFLINHKTLIFVYSLILFLM